MIGGVARALKTDPTVFEMWPRSQFFLTLW